MATDMRLHILSADWVQGTLRIQARDDRGILRDLPWSGLIDWTIGPGRRCVGPWGPDGPMPCPWERETGAEAQCRTCAPVWSDCVFEPPTQHPGCSLCDREHLVYMAFHGTLPKIGMTSARRVAVRLREQGADAWFVVQRRRSRGAARETERTVSMLTGIPEYRTHRETLPLLSRPTPWDGLAARAADWQTRLAERFDVEPVLHQIDHPLPVLDRTVARIGAVGRHRGEVLGARGGHLVYACDDRKQRLATGQRPFLALPRNDLAGRTVTMEHRPKSAAKAARVVQA